MKFIFIHGNGGATAADNWIPATADSLRQDGHTVVAETFPDNEVAHASIWLPFLESLGTDENTILVGHSSGAVAIMRYAQTHKILGSALVGACYTDLGDATERESGYYSAPWQWDNIRANQSWILQFASVDDPYIPIQEARHIRDKLLTQYYEYTDKGHFVFPGQFEELYTTLAEKLS